MAWVGPWLGRGGRGREIRNLWSIFISDIWDPFELGIPDDDWLRDQGVRKDEVKVQVEEGNILQISGERSKERRLGNFLRRFRLPENSKVDEIKCGLKDGVLTVTVPKEETEKKGKLIDVA
ncbi:17.5 kDa class I heat shock protein [Camellia lanceoleosa]|uniref:17.5 kDa class I heat shock protein n=1 Tax=Camellia lanceoleosa TaxID=1840588 RepID=A0ACC0GWG1_9ERIC|nr:17.5 kDa class I heat shock protein [Camellia lanceoleosa]